MKKNTSGFTIVELLIVIVVIGILAAITVVTFRGVQNRAFDATVQSDLKNAHSKIEIYQLEKGKYPRESAALSLPDNLDAAGIKVSRGSYATSSANFIYCPPYPYTSTTNFALFAISKSGKTFIHSSEKGGYASPVAIDMTDYGDECLKILDPSGAFPFDGNWASSPDAHITQPGFSSNPSYPDRWRRWVGGTLAG